MTGTTSPYFIESLILQTPRYDGIIDLKNMFVSCDIFEDMDKPYITADLILNDDKGWYESVDIIGGEKMGIKYLNFKNHIFKNLFFPNVYLSPIYFLIRKIPKFLKIK